MFHSYRPFVLLLLATLVIATLPFSTSLTHGEIDIQQPVADTTLSGAVSITWNATNGTEAVDILFRDGNGTWTTVTDNETAANGSFLWNTAGLNGTEFYLRVQDNGNNSVFDEVGPLTIDNIPKADDDDDDELPLGTLATVSILIIVFIVILSVGMGRKSPQTEGQDLILEKKEETMQVLKETAEEISRDQGATDSAQPVATEQEPQQDQDSSKKSKLRCPSCKKIIAISSDVRPITIQCANCQRKMTIKG